jgi:hypothetical protein
MRIGRLVLLVSFLVPAVMTAAPGPVVTVVDLAKSADLVVVGRLLAPEQVGEGTVALETVPASVFKAQIWADVILKGGADPTAITVSYLIPRTFVGYKTPDAGVSAIYFLTRDGQASIGSHCTSELSLNPPAAA